MGTVKEQIHGTPDGEPGDGPSGEAGADDTDNTGKGGRGRKPAGRRPGGADTRGLVLAAARTEFAASGYEAASVRAIARAAGVDPALVHHYFGTKQQLFLAALDFPMDPRVLVDHMAGGDPASVGERVARFAFTLWEQPGVRERLVATLRAAAGSDQVAQMMRGFLVREVITVVAGRLAGATGDAGDTAEGAGDAGQADVKLRAELAFSQIIGIAMARYVLEVPPIATAGVEELVALVGPTLQRYLGGAGA
jgi:AcrR family transcriptional regulator